MQHACAGVVVLFLFNRIILNFKFMFLHSPSQVMFLSVLVHCIDTHLSVLGLERSGVSMSKPECLSGVPFVS